MIWGKMKYLAIDMRGWESVPNGKDWLSIGA